MKNPMKKLALPAITGVTLLLASCANTIDPRFATTDDELRTMKQAQFAYTADGAMKGAATGAAAGAIGSAVSGGNKKDIQKAAVTGGIAGGALGGFAGFQKGDQAGKKKVAEKRSRQVIESEITAKTKNLRTLTASAERKIKQLREAQAAGESPAAIQKEAKKYYSDYSKLVATNAAGSDYKGVSGESSHTAAFKKAKELDAALASFTKDGNVQKL
jgi:uncharacterized protein YcfJ